MDHHATIAGHLRRHGWRWLIGLGAAAFLATLLALAGAAAALTATPTAAPTPQRTGDLGEKTISGRVVDALQDDVAGIAGATIDYVRVARFPPGESGRVATDAAGEFAFRLFLHDTDSVRISAAAPGYVPIDRTFSGYQLWTVPPIEFALLPARGVVEISPGNAQSLPCEADASVAIANISTEGEPLTITTIWATNSYSQGDYGTGFSADLGAIALPLTLQPGEHAVFPVHYSAAGQTFPSRLTVQLESTARNGPGFAVPYRGEVADCGSPTPTPTPTPPGPVACVGDCDADGTVTIAELVHAVALALGRPVAWCGNADADASGSVQVNEVVAAVAASLQGCAAVP